MIKILVIRFCFTYIPTSLPACCKPSNLCVFLFLQKKIFRAFQAAVLWILATIEEYICHFKSLLPRPCMKFQQSLKYFAQMCKYFCKLENKRNIFLLLLLSLMSYSNEHSQVHINSGVYILSFFQVHLQILPCFSIWTKIPHPAGGGKCPCIN